MGIKLQVLIDQYECDGCGNNQYGRIGEEVSGIVGSFFVHSEAGGSSYDYFACSADCHAKALRKATDTWGNMYGQTISEARP